MSNAFTVLAIDPGSAGGLGWAVMSQFRGGKISLPPPPRLVRSGVIATPQMGADDRTALWSMLDGLLNTWVQQHRAALPLVDFVAYERVHRHSGVHAAHMYGGQVAVIQLACFRTGVPWVTVQVGAVKRFLNLRASGKAKESAGVDAAHALGYTGVTDHNEADAVGVGLAGLDQWRTGKNVYGN